MPSHYRCQRGNSLRRRSSYRVSSRPEQCVRTVAARLCSLLPFSSEQQRRPQVSQCAFHVRVFVQDAVDATALRGDAPGEHACARYWRHQAFEYFLYLFCFLYFLEWRGPASAYSVPKGMIVPMPINKAKVNAIALNSIFPPKLENRFLDH